MSTTKYGSYMSTSGASNFIRPYITYTITSTNTSYTCTWTGGCNVKTNYHTNAKITLKSTATGMSSQSTTVDDKNWGGGNHKMLSGTYTWSRTTSAATKTIKLTMSTNVDSSSVSLSISVAALPTVTITYNGNGGTYSGSSTTLYYDVAGKVTTTKPTRLNYTFLYWIDNATSKTYTSGASITRTSNLTLYAVWKLNYIAPTVNGEAILYRVADDAEGRSPEVTNSGTRAYIEFTTSKGLSVTDYFYNNSYSISVNGVTLGGGVTTSLELIEGESSNTYWGYIGSSLDDLFNVSTRYSIVVQVTLRDGDGKQRTISATSFLSAEIYMMDLSSDGKRVAFGQMASDAASGETRDFGIETPGTIYGIDYMSNLYGMIGFERENTPGLWIGRKNDYTKAMHGHLVISTGWTYNDTTHANGYGYMAPMVSVPTKYDTNGLESGGLGYPILHAGNLVYKTFTSDSVTVSASSIKDVTIDISKSGYTPIAFANACIINTSSTGTNMSWCFIYYKSFNSSTCTVSFRNTNTTASAVVQVRVTILYKQTSNSVTYQSANSIGMLG